MAQETPVFSFSDYTRLAQFLDCYICERVVPFELSAAELQSVATLSFGQRLPLFLRRMLLQSSSAIVRLPDLTALLDTLYESNLHRTNKIREQALSAISLLNAIQVRPLLFKASALYLRQPSKYSEDRISRDLDLLIPASQFREGLAVFTANGYQIKEQMEGDLHHVTLIHPDKPVELELHQDIFAPLGRSYLSTEEVLAHAEPRENGGVSFLEMPTRYFCLYQVIHGFIHHTSYVRRTIPLRVFFEIASLSQENSYENDCEFLRARFAERGATKMLNGILYMTKKLFPLACRYTVKPNGHGLLYAIELRATGKSAGLAMLVRGVTAFSRPSLEQRFSAAEFVTHGRGALTLRTLEVLLKILFNRQRWQEVSARYFQKA